MTKSASGSVICPELDCSIDFPFQGWKTDIYFETCLVMNLRLEEGASTMIILELGVTSSSREGPRLSLGLLSPLMKQDPRISSLGNEPSDSQGRNVVNLVLNTPAIK